MMPGAYQHPAFAFWGYMPARMAGGRWGDSLQEGRGDATVEPVGASQSATRGWSRLW